MTTQNLNPVRKNIALLALALGLAAILPLLASAQTPEDGSPEHPFLIENKQELEDFHECMVPGSKFYFVKSTGTYSPTKPAGTAGTDFAVIPEGGRNTHFRLSCDIVFNSGNVAGCNGVMDSSWVAWTPMEIFNGHFDGDHHTVSGLFCTSRGPSSHYSANELGFFTQVNDSASVKNLGITNSYISGAEAVGGITGWLLSKAEIKNCFFEGTLLASHALCGGIAGATGGNANIENCYASGRITSQSNEVGGIVGRSGNGSTVHKCYSSMILESDGTLTGGIVGNNVSSTFDSCYYDKQMTPPERVSNSIGTGLLTAEMADADWTGLGPAFACRDDYYPYISGFPWDNPSVKMSSMPLFLNYESSSIYDDISNLKHDFQLGITDGFSWSASSLNNAISLDSIAPGSPRQNARLHKQGIVDLIVSDGVHSRTYTLYPNIAPYLGSEQNPFCINSLADLTSFRNGINGAADFKYQRYSISYSNLPNIHWLQTSDIDMASVPNWTPIGNSFTTPFIGNYDGGHHEIIHLTYNSSNADNKGFFYFSRGNIKNLGFRDPYMYCRSHSAALASCVMSGVIDHCYTTGENAYFSYTGQYCGALIAAVGRMDAYKADTVMISNCYNTCDIFQPSLNTFGGVVGFIDSKNAVVIRCYNTGDFFSRVGMSHDWRGGIGGVAGATAVNTITGNFSFCYNTGNITSIWNRVGGVVGNSGNPVKYCFNTGNITYIPPTVESEFFIGGVSVGSTNYCFNTGKITCNTSNGDLSIGGVSANVAVHCFNTGEVIITAASNWKKYRVAGVAQNQSVSSYNAGRVTGVMTKYGCSPWVLSSSGSRSFYDKNMCVEGTGNYAKTTGEMIGTSSVMRADLGDADWIYEEGMYPRLRWTDTCDWARDVAIAACSPVLFPSADADVDHAKPGMRLFGCDSSVVWSIDSGAMVTDLRPESCLGNAITPALADACTGSTILSASVNGQKVKEVVLRRYVEPITDTLTIDSLADLTAFKEGVNSGGPFYYKGRLVPIYAERTHFKLTTDIALPDSNWTPIGTVPEGNSFKGVFLGANHTISNLHCSDRYAGLFGEVRGRVQDLNLTEVSLTEGHIRGAVCAHLYNGVIRHCSAEGTNIDGEPYGSTLVLGGIVGLSYGKDTIRDCINLMRIESDYSNSNVGGICALATSNGTFITHCVNKAPLQGGARVAGICASSYSNGYIRYCSNLAEITGSPTSFYVAGIATRCADIRYCYNVGEIRMMLGNKDVGRYLGGILSSEASCYYCYNAGAIYGANAYYVGGICGNGKAYDCYNSNLVSSSGKCVGSITGSNNQGNRCYYDKQMSTIGGIAGTDYAGKAEGKTTEQMLGNGLQSLLTGGCWTFTTLLYPQLTAFAGTDASIASVMPVHLSNNETWDKVNQSFYLHGCDVGDWVLLQAGKIELDTAGNHCQTLVTGMGVSVLGSSVNGQVYRQVRLLVQINEDNPLIIKNLTELKNFRDVINSSSGYYYFRDKTYHTSLPDGANPDDFLEIKEGGKDLYFKLTTDIDMSGESDWQPIGDNYTNSEWSFQGNFNGAGHTINGLKIQDGQYKGLFGQIKDGTVCNLTIDSSKIVGTGRMNGLLCSNTKGGLIKNCIIQNCKMSDANSASGLLCGFNNYLIIKQCNVVNDTLLIKGDTVGGLCGFNLMGTIDSCLCDHLYMDIQKASKIIGGVCGWQNASGYITYSQIQNSKIISSFAASAVGGIAGTAASFSSGYPNYFKHCSFINTTIEGSNMSYVGGILGTSGESAKISYCNTSGGIIKGSNRVGGISGEQSYRQEVRYCINETPIYGNDGVGGIVGSLYSGSCYNNENRASINGNSHVGGINGSTSYCGPYNCVNRGTVKGTGNGVGGITGTKGNSDDIQRCINIGLVQGIDMVGGIVGELSSRHLLYSYNAGIVQGRSMVGGLIGAITNSGINVKQSINVGLAEGLGNVGSICGRSLSTLFEKCYYDSQMCPVGAVEGKNMTGVMPKLTSEMAGMTLQSELDGTQWICSNGMYPRIKTLDTNVASISAALPVWLPTSPDTITAADVPVGKYGLAGCDSTSWIRYSGEKASIVGCDTLQVTGRNVVQIANVIDGDTLKKVQMYLGISEKNPLEITNLTQFKKFRDLINSGNAFYYDDANEVFYAENSGEFIEIKPYGEKMFFKLTTDIDLSLESDSWEPIGNYRLSTSKRFKGHFNGDNHSVIDMVSTSDGDANGLFGCIEGTVKNLKLINPKVSGKNSCGSVTGLNYGTICNCRSIGGSVTSKSNGNYNHTGGVAGYCYNGVIENCYNSSTVSGRYYVGGICGTTQQYSVIKSCFNSGTITTLVNDSRCGGIVGNNLGGEVSNCYNVGSVSGRNYVGGIVGWSIEDWYTAPRIRNCYNVGFVSSSLANPKYVCAISSTNDVSYEPNNCFYDSQMSGVRGGIGTTSQAADKDGKAVGLYTENMVGNALSDASKLGEEYWTYTDSLYPRLKAMANYDASIVTTQPVFISEHLRSDAIKLPFIVKTNDSISWSRQGSGISLDISNLENGKLGIVTCGYDTLKVSKGQDYKIVPLYVESIQGSSVVDTACDGYYRWAANGRIYTASTKVTIAITIAEGCDSIMSLDLTIPPAIRIEMASRNYSCYESSDAYAEATVTGGFNSGYYYDWTDAGGHSVGTGKRIDNPVPGTYTLTVRDSIHPACEKSATVTITKPTELVLTQGAYDSQCYNQNDGYLAFSVSGGSLPYTLSWSGGSSGSMPISQACTDTITGLADGTYTVTVTDNHGCVKELTGIAIEDNETLHSITAYGISKMYDGEPVSPQRFILKVGENAADTIASGGYKVLASGDTLRASVSASAASVKDVCNFNNALTYTITNNGEDKSCRYNVSANSSIVEIARRDVTLTSASDQKPYDNTPLTNHTVTVSGSGFAAGEDTLSCSVTGSQTLVGASANTFDYTLTPGTNPDNYEITKVEGLLFVGKADTVYVIAVSDNKMYDGDVLSNPNYTYIGPILAEDTVLAVVEGSITNAGTTNNIVTSYRVVQKTDHSIDHTDQYAFGESVPGTLTVTKRNVTLSTVSDSKVYDGAPLARPTVTLSGDGFVPGEVTGYSASQSITNAGSVTNTIDVNTTGSYSADNYNLTKNEGVLTVTKRPLTIIGDSRSIDYDGVEHTISTYTAPNLLTGHTISGISYAATGTDVGTFVGAFSDTASLVIKDADEQVVTSNYQVGYQTGALFIGQSSLPLVVRSNSHSFTYDGQLHTYQDYTVLYNDVSIAATSSLNYTLPTNDHLVITPKDKGTGITHVSESGKNSFSITLDNFENYASVTLDTGRIDISKRLIELRSRSESAIYSGSAIPTDRTDASVSREGLGFAIGEGVTCTITGSQTVVGSSPNTFTYVPNGATSLNDYEIVQTNGTLTIVPATLTVTANNASMTYGDAMPTFSYSLSGFVNHEDTLHGAPFIGTVRPVLTTTATSTSPAGQYPINVDLTGVSFANYVPVGQEGRLTISRKALTVAANSVSGITYDGNAHTWRETAAPHYHIVSGSLLGNDTITNIILSGSRTVAGTSLIEPSSITVKHIEGTDTTDVSLSYDVAFQNGSITILPVEIKLKPYSFEHDFTGNTYNSDSTDAPHYRIVSGALVGRDSIVDITINGSRSAYGKTPFVIDSASIMIVDTNEVSSYAEIQPSQLRNAGYHIILDTATLNIKHRSSPYQIHLVGKDSSLTYNGQSQLWSGWETTVFERDGFTYHVVGLTSSVSGENVGDYETAISGTARVLGANDEDVSAEFEVTSETGTLTITPKPMTITAKGVNVVYDFLEHSYADNLFPYCDVSGMCPGHNIRSIKMEGKRTIVGRTPIHIVPDSVVIVNTSNDTVTNNYNITLIDSAINITERSGKIAITLTSKSGTQIYDGLSHTLTGFDTLRYMIEASDAQRTKVYFHIDPTSVSATTGPVSTVGVYSNVISGTPIVRDAQENDVSESFEVSLSTGALTITQRPITVTARDTNFYYDGAAHNASQMSDPKFTVDNLCAGHTVITTVTSADQTAIGSTPTILGAVTVRDASSNDVSAYFQITKHNGTLTVSGFPGAITITSASAELECNGTAQKREQYTVTFAGSPVTAQAGTGGLKFVLPTVNNDTLTITPTFAGITTKAENAPNNNVYTYVLQHDVQYVGTRTVTFGTIKMYDSLKVVTAETPVTCNGAGDGKSDVTISGGKKNAGNYSYKLDGGTATNTTGTVNLTNLGSGSHSFYVKDSLGYDKTVTITITQPDALTLTLATDDPVYGDGTVMSHSTGGNGGNKYKLNGSNENNHGVYNGLSAGSYTVTVTDAKGCTSTESATLTATAVTETEGVTRSGNSTSYAKDSTVSRSGSLTDFPALTRSGDVIAQPALDSLRATRTGQTVTVEAYVKAVGAATVLELEVATDGSFTASTVMYTYKFTGTSLTTGWKSHGFADLPVGTYHIRAKLYNGGGAVTRTMTGTVTVP